MQSARGIFQLGKVYTCIHTHSAAKMAGSQTQAEGRFDMVFRAGRVGDF